MSAANYDKYSIHKLRLLIRVIRLMILYNSYQMSLFHTNISMKRRQVNFLTSLFLIWNLKRYKAWNLWFLFPLALLLFLSSCQLFKVKTSLFEWKHCHISLKWWSFQPIYLFEQKKCNLMTFLWRLESERTRAGGKRNHKFPA